MTCASNSFTSAMPCARPACYQAVRYARRPTGQHQSHKLRRALIAVPDTLDEQRAIIERVNSVSAAIEDHRRERAKLASLREGLRDDLLTGRAARSGHSGGCRVSQLDRLDELNVVERPLLRQLGGMGWSHVEGADEDPSSGRKDYHLLGRTDFQQTLLHDRLEAALCRLNRNDDGSEWLDDRRINQAISQIERPTARTSSRSTRSCTTRCPRRQRLGPRWRA